MLSFGKISTTYDLKSWSQEVENLGAGEILVQSIDNDGKGKLNIPKKKKRIVLIEKTINNNPEKFFTDEVMERLEEVVREYFKYGNTNRTDDTQESDTE